MFYRDDLFGYDDLFTFVDIFPTYTEWLKLNEYMFYNQVEEYEKAEQLYNMVLNVYKNHFFRYSTMPRIYTEVSLRLERLYQEINVSKEITDNAASLAGTSTTSESYKTNNTQDESDPENNKRFRTNIETSFTDNGAYQIELMNNTVNGVTRINDFVKDLRTLMMNQTNEVVVKQGIYTKGR